MLVVARGPSVGRKFTIDRVATIGRSESATVFLEDSEVSRHHVEIRQTDDHDYVIQDLGSRNGTSVNGVRITRRFLAVGDEIQLGPNVVLVFARRDPLEDAIHQRQRLEALGRLTAGIAHDFNNMIGAVSATADYLAQLPPEAKVGSPAVSECLDDVRSAAQRAAALSRSLIEFAKGTGAGHKTVDLSTLCHEVVQVVRRTFDRSIEIESKIEPGLRVEGDPTELHQILMNLCVNARDAMLDGGTLSIEARAARGPSKTPVRAARGDVIVSVADTGVGIDPGAREHIFEPFFTTKARGSGFGIGLATVRDLVDGHSGVIEVASELGSGTRFDVHFPLSTRAQSRVGIATPMTRIPASMNEPGGATVLLVDDEAIVRRALRRVLRQGGYEVIEARDGVEAVALYTDLARRPDLLILDLDMPRMRGDEALTKIRAFDPGVRALFVSGHQQLENIGADVGDVSCLQKPCSATDLLIAVSNAVDSFDPEDMTLTGKVRGQQRQR